MSQKAYVVQSETQPGKFRLVINVTDEYSTGTVLSQGELSQLFYEIKNLLDSQSQEGDGNT